MKSLLLICAFLLGTQCYGQVKKIKTFFPIWSFNQQDVNIFGVSTGLFTSLKKESNANTNGLRLELIGLGFFLIFAPESPVTTTEDETLETGRGERVNGLSLSTLGSVCACKINGISLSGVGQYQYQINGIAASAAINFYERVNGVQIGGTTYAYSVNGAQFSFLSANADRLNGLQVSALNSSEETKGVQVGIVNHSTKLKGIQIGLWNVNEKRKLPLINWNFDRKNKKRTIKL